MMPHQEDGQPLYRSDPAGENASPHLYSLYEQEIRQLIAAERSVLNQIQMPSSQPDARNTRLDALKARRTEVEMFTTRNRERDRRAKRFLITGIGAFILIPAFQLQQPRDLYLAANQGTEWLAGFNGTFVAFIGLLSIVFLLGTHALRLVFEPWLSGRMKNPNPEAARQPQIQLVSQRVWRLRRYRIPGTGLGIPLPTRYYRTLPITQEDLLAAALEHLHAAELSTRQPSTDQQ
ncbi:hypothetical protein [Marinobacter nauticus]|uniref:Uncharacterized protein n=1 Tax=Marinobacter nauticus (strain ATCC 700491 / DSM 11845 / VT8) TaxID=351348 RepID=A1U822_MARN8|nr:hypothetical protein [Marinobacter nauticus]ABM21141.1 hypothetical protein Maqu_4290 [Marinobacter nauticus VT8]|tara:strand:+ start:724 stop:1425 length:702 start_codon:yes stop_codon:yes gene_type:complete